MNAGIFCGVTQGDFLQDIHALCQLPEDTVAAVKPRLGRIADKELGAVGIGRPEFAMESAPAICLWSVISLGKCIAGAARAGSGGVAALRHKVGNNAVEGSAVIKSLRGQVRRKLLTVWVHPWQKAREPGSPFPFLSWRCISYWYRFSIGLGGIL